MDLSPPIEGPVLRMHWPDPNAPPDVLLTREWLVTNGLGGYASGTVSGAPTRRYHGHLIAALPAPYGRTLMLGPVSEQVRLPNGEQRRFGMAMHVGESAPPGEGELLGFRLEAGIPVWTYGFDGFVVEKSVLLPHGMNTVYVRYQLARGEGKVRLKLRPGIHFRSHDAPVSAPLHGPYKITVVDERIEVASAEAGLPPLHMQLHGAGTAFTIEGKTLRQVLYRIEQSRGYESEGDLWSPGYFRADLAENQSVTLVASAEGWGAIQALPPAAAFLAERARRDRLLQLTAPNLRLGTPADLVFAADQFLITPAGRYEEAARARAAGDEARTVIAGYHWFTDWGRDTMISLEGLTLTTGRHAEAGYILRTFAHYVRDGLIPNLFPEGEKEGLYHTADATLWFFHALARYLDVTGDGLTLRMLLPGLQEIIEHHLKGTRFNIHVDPSDGLLSQGAPGYQLTWMDAKVGDWVVTPRRGKAVEINALWYNALCLTADWVEGERGAEAARPLRGHAEKARASFNRRFWNPQTGYLFDVVDGEHGDDPSCRPNQLFAVSLPHPVLDRSKWAPVFEVCRQKLLTPVGLRSLAPGSPDYKPRYYGDLRSRDAAYHQGTVWAWLIGPFVDAYLKLHPGDKAGARKFLEGFVPQLGEACIGSISEIFDAEPPYTPRGCIAQAWSVAEVLRCWAKTAT